MRKLILLAMLLVGCSNPLSSGPGIDDLRTEISGHSWATNGLTILVRVINLHEKTFNEPYVVTVVVSANGQVIGTVSQTVTFSIFGKSDTVDRLFLETQPINSTLTFDVSIKLVE